MLKVLIVDIIPFFTVKPFQCQRKDQYKLFLKKCVKVFIVQFKKSLNQLRMLFEWNRKQLLSPWLSK